jgi:hypothetical protein
VPEAKRRVESWTTRLWPGAVVVNGESRDVAQRGAEVSIDAWRRFSPMEREAVEAEATPLPLGLERPIRVRW